MSNDDDDGPAKCKKPNLDCIIEASLIDDLGVNSAVFERIIGFCRSWHHRWANDSSLGLSKNLRTIQMARQQAEPKIRMPELSSDS